VGDQVALLGQHVGEQGQCRGVVRQAEELHATLTLHTTILILGKTKIIAECSIIFAHYA
jgi:hypothetical protein